MPSLLALLALLAVAVGCAAPQKAATSFEVVTGKPDATIHAQAAGDDWLFEIFSSSGIGSASIRAISTAPPSRVILRLHLAGLEGLRFEYDATVITVAVASSGAPAVFEAVLTGGARTETTIAEGSPYWMPVRLAPQGDAEPRIPLQGGYIELEAPADFVSGGHRAFTLAWVDFYR